MGCDIHLFCEGYLNVKWINIDNWYRKDGWAKYMVTENQGFHYINLIEGHRDYHLFYLLAGVRRDDEEESYPSIARPKGLPKDMDPLIKKYQETVYGTNFEDESLECHHVSYLTLKEIKDSGYGDIMTIRGWVEESKFIEATEALKNGQKYEFRFFDVKRKLVPNGLVL